MSRIFVGLATVHTISLIAACVLGFRADSRVALAAGTANNETAIEAFQTHFGVGLLAGVLTLMLHSIIFTYFIGTGRWVKETVKAYGLPDSMVRLTRRFKARTSPPALFSMLFVIAVAVMGAAVDTGAIASTWHLAGAVLAILLNLVSYVVEFRAVRENMVLLDQVMHEVQSIRRARGLAV